jgi:hypothetical protein
MAKMAKMAKMADMDDFAAGVVRVVQLNCTRDPEFILRELSDKHKDKSEGSVRRVLRWIPGLYEMTSRLRTRDRSRSRSRFGELKETKETKTKSEPIYSSITAGKFPSDVNYAGRVFQLDLVFLPHLLNVNGTVVREPNLIPVLTCVCVASRYALLRRLRDTTHPHVYSVMRQLLELIYNKLDDIMDLDGRRVREGYYTEASFRERCAAAQARRDGAGDGKATAAKEARVLAFYERASDRARGPFLDEWRAWPTDVPFIRDLKYGRPIACKFVDYIPREDGEARKANWLVDLADMQLRSDATEADVLLNGRVDQRALDRREAQAADRREVSEPWNRVHPHVTFVTDDGEFTVARKRAHEYAASRGYPAPHWCTVNKSELPRKGVQIVERFHRTLRSMWAISYTMQTAAVAGLNVDDVLERLIPATYNATRSRSTMCTPDSMWSLGVDGTAQRARVGMPSAFPVGSLVTIPVRPTGETHPVVFRSHAVFVVVAKNVYTREIAPYNGTSGVDLRLGPIAPNQLRGIRKPDADRLAQTRRSDVSARRPAIAASDKTQARSELVDMNKSNNDGTIGPKSSLALVKNTGPTSKYADDAPVDRRVSRAASDFVRDNGTRIIQSATNADIHGKTIADVMRLKLQYTDPVTGKGVVYGPGSLSDDIANSTATTIEGRTLRTRAPRFGTPRLCLFTI